MTRFAHDWVDVPAEQPVDTAMPATAEAFAETMGYASASYTSREELLGHADHSWIAELRAALMELLDPGRSVLSVGSGTGEHEAPLAAAGYDVTASDLSTAQLQDAVRLFPELKAIEFDALSPDVEHGYDDLLAAGIDYAFDDAQLHRFLTGARAVVRPGGRVVFVLRYQDNPVTWVIDRALLPLWAVFRRGRYRMTGRAMKVIRRDHGYRRSRREVRHAAERAGWRVGRVLHAGAGMELSRLPLPGPVLRAGRRADRHLHVFENAVVYELLS